MNKVLSKNNLLSCLLILGVTIPVVYSTKAAYSQVGLTPLELFYSGNRGDNFTTGTDIGRSSANDAGYSLVRVEGCAFLRQQPGTRLLTLCLFRRFSLMQFLCRQRTPRIGFFFSRA